MEEFYSLLRKYNKTHVNIKFPDWTNIYLDTSPPIYWTVLSKLLKEFSKDSSIFEIGVGAGDILTLIRSIGFTDVKGIECDKQLADFANKKIDYFFQTKQTVINDNYPISIIKPNILIQVNCVYFDDICNKKEYLELLKTYYQNANPDVYFLEVVDSSFTKVSEIYPEFVRLSENDIKNTFKNKNIVSYFTYQYPQNTSSKRLYVIS
jgi:hypothetical protein